MQSQVTKEPSVQFTPTPNPNPGEPNSSTQTSSAKDPAIEARELADKVLRGESDSAGVEVEVGESPGTAVESATAGKVKPGRDLAVSPDSEKEPVVEHAKDSKPVEDEDKAPDLETVLKNRHNKRQKQVAEQERIAAIERKAQELEANQTKLTQRLQQDPIGALRDLGFTEEQIAQRLLGQAPKGNPLEERLHKLERELALRTQAEERARQEAAQAQQAQAVDSVKRGFVGYVASNSEKYEALAAFYDDAPEDLATEALNIANIYTEQTGKDVTFEQVASFLDDRLTARYNNLQKRRGGNTKPAEQTASTARQRTLSPAVSQRTSAPAKQVSDMTEDERRSEAVRLANQMLKSR